MRVRDDRWSPARDQEQTSGSDTSPKLAKWITERRCSRIVGGLKTRELTAFAMAERDDFPAKVRNAVALRAGHRCSFPGCGQPTVGPSDESPMAVANVGVAAHICAAARGGRRYDAGMTSEQRSSIENAIWMCATHGTLIDRDETKYTPQLLRQWKRDHEARAAQEVAGTRSTSAESVTHFGRDLIAIGPDVVAVGELRGVGGEAWDLRLVHFLKGDVSALIEFGERIGNHPRMDRFVLVNALGDGRVVKAPPSWTRSSDGSAIDVHVEVEPKFPRIKAQDLGTDIELIDGDLPTTMSLISGVRRVPQHIQIVLGWQKGMEFDASDFGSRVSEFFALFGGTPWFQSLVKLEAIRLAAIPYVDTMTKSEHTQFRCVERVLDLILLEEAPKDRRLPIRLMLEVTGIGRWEHTIDMFVSEYPPVMPELPSKTMTGP